MPDVIYGVDVSSYQGEIDWEQVKAAGIAFVVCKASEGGTASPDRVAYFKQAVKGAHEAGLLVSGYHFYRGSADPYVQAEVFFDAVCQCQYEMDFCGALDVETTDNTSRSYLSQTVAQCMQSITDKWGKHPMLYSYVSFLENSLDLSYFGGYPRWVADWGWCEIEIPGVPDWECELPSGWSYTDCWQYSESGVVAGVGGPVDLDLYWGSAEQLKELGSF